MIAAVLLAAGSASRFGAPKLLEDLRGVPILRRSADALARARIDELLVVVPPSHEELRIALRGCRVRLVVNPDPERGIASSIACGVAALRSETVAMLVALGDEPTLSSAVVDQVIGAYREEPKPSIVVPHYGSEPGHPVLFDRGVFPELLTLQGDRGARVVVERDPARVARVVVREPAPMDVDTPEDLARLRREGQYMTPTSPITPDHT